MNSLRRLQSLFVEGDVFMYEAAGVDLDDVIAMLDDAGLSPSGKLPISAGAGAENNAGGKFVRFDAPPHLRKYAGKGGTLFLDVMNGVARVTKIVGGKSEITKFTSLGDLGKFLRIGAPASKTEAAETISLAAISDALDKAGLSPKAGSGEWVTFDLPSWLPTKGRGLARVSSKGTIRILVKVKGEMKVLDEFDSMEKLQRWSRKLKGDPKETKAAEKSPMACNECGYKFEKKITKGTVEVKCPQCGSYDTELA